MALPMPAHLVERPSGDPQTLRECARRIGGHTGHVHTLALRVDTAGQAVTRNLPLRRIREFGLVAWETRRLHERISRSLQTVEGALLDYATHLERAQDAVDQFVRNDPILRPLPGAPADEPGHRMRAPYETPGGIHSGDTDHMRAPHESLHDITDPSPARHVDPIGVFPPPSRVGAEGDVQAALAELRGARQRCMNALHSVEVDWSNPVRGNPIRWRPVAPILPPRVVGAQPVRPIERVPSAPVQIGRPVRPEPLPVPDPGGGMRASPVSPVGVLPPQPSGYEAPHHVIAGPIGQGAIRRVTGMIPMSA